MGSYLNQLINERSVLKYPEKLQEAFIYLELSACNDDVKKDFIRSPEAKAMINEGLITSRTTELLTKNNRSDRNVKLAALQLAKEQKDPIWDKLVQTRINERALINEAVEKYGEQVESASKLGSLSNLKTVIPSRYFKVL